MFNGSDQLHQFIVASSRNIPLFHGNHQSIPPGFDPYRSSSQLQELHHQSQPFISKIDNEERSTQPWSNDEVLLLLKLRSNIDNWFPNNFSWEHVSRKLEELGIKRSAEECKEKFEQESDHHHVSYNKNYRILSELDELYRPGGNQEEMVNTSPEMIKQNEENRDQKMSADENSGDVREMISEEVVKKSVKPIKKRKRRGEKFEMLKGYCEAIVNKMMAQQEEMHNKLIEDIMKRDEEIIAREEEWKNQEMDRTKLEIEKMAKEQASIGERHAIIIEFLKKFTSEKALINLPPNSSTDATPPTCNSPLITQNSTGSTFSSQTILLANNSLLAPPLQPIVKSQEQTDKIETRDKLETTPTSSSMALSHQNPSSFPSQTASPQTIIPVTKDLNQDSSSDQIMAFGSDCDRKEDIGMRWPRDQVLALINMRCKLSNATSNNDESTKGPLWERISQGMMELGYKRSAKRCKEKWENINKYFRKTKDSNKKRSMDSRTCPYFHQLSRLYSDGTLVAPGNEPENPI